jgi:uncharacterized membrane protein
VNPDVVSAIEGLREKQVLSEAQAAPLQRVARGELVSIHWELRALLYSGVLLLTTGLGLFLKENHERLGPAVLASLIGLAAAICFVYVLRRSPPFSWRSTPTQHIAADYVLLLGVLLIASDLAYIETQFRWLGPRWPEHLLIVSLLYLFAAYRFDSRAVLSLALTSFAAWRGVSAALPYAAGSHGYGPAVRANALACGVAFVAVGIVSVRLKRKAHFEGVWVTLGLLLLFGGLLSGVFQKTGSDWPLWEIPLVVCAAVVIAVAYRLRRPLDFALGVLAAYLGALRWLAEALEGAALAFTIGVSSLALIAFLIRAQRRMKAPA